MNTNIRDKSLSVDESDKRRKTELRIKELKLTSEGRKELEDLKILIRNTILRIEIEREQP